MIRFPVGSCDHVKVCRMLYVPALSGSPASWEPAAPLANVRAAMTTAGPRPGVHSPGLCGVGRPELRNIFLGQYERLPQASRIENAFQRAEIINGLFSCPRPSRAYSPIRMI